MSVLMLYFRTLSFALLFSLASLAALADEFAPDFQLKEIASEHLHRLSDYRGKVIYLDFWASWCGPCRKSLPALSRLQEELGREEFEVLAINLDEDPEDGRRFLREYPVSYTVLADGSGAISRVYDLVGLPSSVLIDQQGVVVASFQGFHPSHISKLRKAVGILID